MPKLTKRLLDRIKPGDRDIVLWDVELQRFGLRVKPSGAMTYVVQYRNAAGRTRKLALGRVGVLTPDEARQKARIALGRVAEGHDPSASRSASRGAMTVSTLCDEYMAAAEKGLILARRGGVSLRQPLPPTEAGSRPHKATAGPNRSKGSHEARCSEVSRCSADRQDCGAAE